MSTSAYDAHAGSGEAKRELSRLRELFVRAVKFLFAGDFSRAIVARDRLSRECCRNSLEMDLFRILMAIMHPSRENAGNVVCGLKKIRKRISGDPRLVNSVSYEVEYLREIYVLTVYAEATYYYYGEKDSQSLRLYEDCNALMKKHDMRTILDVVILSDVQHKILALDFVNTENAGFKKIVRLAESGELQEACRLMNQTLRKNTLSFFDHDVILFAAKINLARGNVKKAVYFANAAYNDRQTCLEVQFFLALMLFCVRSRKSRQAFMSVAQRICDEKTRWSCRMDPTRKKRMRKVIRSLESRLPCGNSEFLQIRKFIVDNVLDVHMLLRLSEMNKEDVIIGHDRNRC